MGLLRRIGSILGFLKDDNPHAAGDEEDDDHHHHHHRTTPDALPRGPRKGFSVQVPVPASAAASAGPIVVPCSLGEGGVQVALGFRWYGERLRIDEDGDVADEFLDEVLPPDNSGAQEQSALPRFAVKYSTRPAPVRKQIIAVNGNIHPSMEYQGMLRWV